ncbi:ead/Ea22-like family protein [Enterobacter asburiae]|uniref:ead/Ea22-like family protein n=1 Tax=Enterobacter asburiae TaxID=61645 RepID=UPI001E521F52|nr:ead/Ea22-like family protein [Enterobacter asburiae]MCE2000809.1 ead/Ea22-like family protein [Enterobacter asburiae]
MSNIDKRALRVLATALDGDDWHAEGNSVYGGPYDVGDNVCYDHIASCESVNGESPLADFIAAANPATVLALLDELEAVQKTSAARLSAIDTTHKMFQRERDRAEAAEKRIAELERERVAMESVTLAMRDDMRTAAAGKGEAS